MRGLPFSIKLDLNSYIVSISKTAFLRQLETWFVLLSFFLPRMRFIFVKLLPILHEILSRVGWCSFFPLEYVEYATQAGM